tara:strand:- start:124 stop:333 length:210 start_codon:yes stop_codon:yes gene_type:complete
VKKNFVNKSQTAIENNSKNIYLNQQTKTTNVNILLNRVRLDKKKIFKKRLVTSFIIISLISLSFAYLIL